MEKRKWKEGKKHRCEKRKGIKKKRGTEVSLALVWMIRRDW